ncbi:MAG: hypothetical protein SFV19_04490 [Rhodospirillaceae bacterium]|nr:hypothetical protein [Rhodospirillaceae bacterium]
MSDPATKILDERIDKALAKRMTDGSGGGGDMTVERRLEQLEQTVGQIALDMGELKGKVSNLPSTFQVATFCFGSMIGLAGLIFAIIKLNS